MTNQPLPVPVAGGQTFVTLSASDRHTCGLTTSGAAYCWGHNNSGQLGDGTTTDRSTPTAVLGGLSFASLDSGMGTDNPVTCGVTTAGEGYCWGSNERGGIGDGLTGGTFSTPEPVLLSDPLASISAGVLTTCALTTDGIAFCWGFNGNGQLGNGETSGPTAGEPFPAQVLGGLTFSYLKTWWKRTCGITTGGEAYCWGDNQGGQLGNGTTEDSSVPVRVLDPEGSH